MQELRFKQSKTGIEQHGPEDESITVLPNVKN
jgi:hypothetical protein